MTTSHQDGCPFRVGQTVIYRPSERGIGLDTMTPTSEKLVPGNAYRIASIQDGVYLVVDGNIHPGGGLHWTEFSMT
jgi:hypothetical protein